MRAEDISVSCPFCGDENGDTHERMQLLKILCISVLFSMPLLWGLNPKIQFALATVVQFYPGSVFYRGAIKNLKQGVLGMDFLVSLSTTIIYLYSTYVCFTVFWDVQLYFESECVLISLILFGRYMEMTSRHEASSAIRKLIQLQPDKTRVLRDGDEQEVQLCEIRDGDRILIGAYEHIPVDALVSEGICMVDESMLTGESEPVCKIKGSPIYCGTLCLSGDIQIEAATVNPNTALQQIVDVMAAAQSEKPPLARLADKIATIFVPVILLISTGVFCLWYFCLSPGNLGTAVKCVCATMVIACPCALGLATPTSLMTGTGRAAELGVLFKGGEQLETADKVDTIIFDKTGTLTYRSGASEEIREDALEAIRELKENGIELWIISGDKKERVNRIADEAGIDNVIFEIDPSGKAEKVKELQQQGKCVAMVGDGINDSPAMVSADVGIAMGSGDSIAIEAADIMIVGDSLKKIPLAIDISRATKRNIRQNLIWALIYNLICIPLAASGAINPSIAAAAMALSSNGVLLNSLRLKKYGNRSIQEKN